MEGDNTAVHNNTVSMDNDGRMTSLYESLPLPPNSKCVRVLDVEAAPAKKGGWPIVGNLRIVDLEERPSFSALSYVWGAPPRFQTIICGDLCLDVTENGNAALQHLRGKLGKFTIWIDAICINQKDKIEKEQQIPLMGDVYSRAEKAYMWLGEGNEKSDRAMAFLARSGLLEYFPIEVAEEGSAPKPRTWAALWSFYNTSLRYGSGDLLPSTKSEPKLLLFRPFLREVYPNMRTSFDDLKNVFDRDWIRRIWTYQEVMLASNPIIVCGHYHLQWVRLVCSILFLEQFATLTNYDQEFEDILDVWKTLAYSKARFTSESTSWHAGHWKLHQLENYRSFARSIALKHVGIRKRLRDLHNIVSLFCRPLVPVLLHKFPPDLRLPPQALILEEWVDTILSRNATNPKDKSFGLHNILQNLLKYTIPPPDYSISIGQIYKELSVHLIKATGLLHLLLPAALNSFPDQPSWVPDWSKSPPKGWRDSRLYSQSPKDSVCGWSAENSNALTVQARQLGIVCSCYKFRSTEDSYNQSERIIHLGNLEALVGFIGTFNSSRLAYTFLQQALHNTGNFRIPGTYLREFVRFTYKLHGNTLSRIFHGLLDDSNRDKWRILLPRRQIWPLTISAFVLPTWETFDFLHTHIRLCNYLAINKLSLVRVKTGESCYDVGVCTSNAEACDKVIYVSGGCSLFLVRGDASSARLVSPARMLRQRFQAANNTSDTGFWEKVVPAQSSRSSSQAIMDLIPEDYTLY